MKKQKLDAPLTKAERAESERRYLAYLRSEERRRKKRKLTTAQIKRIIAKAPVTRAEEKETPQLCATITRDKDGNKILDRDALFREADGHPDSMRQYMYLAIDEERLKRKAEAFKAPIVKGGRHGGNISGANRIAKRGDCIENHREQFDELCKKMKTARGAAMRMSKQSKYKCPFHFDSIARHFRLHPTPPKP